jgi:hypothetical protein
MVTTKPVDVFDFLCVLSALRQQVPFLGTPINEL